MRLRPHDIRRLAGSAILGAALIAGCSSGTEPPVAGDLVIHFVSPNADDRALVLYVDGDTQGVRPASGFRLFSPGVGRSEASSDRFLVIVPEGGGTIPANGVDVAFLAVEDVRQAESYTVSIEGVGAEDYSQRSLSGYEATIDAE